jgi:hypothetical protein
MSNLPLALPKGSVRAVIALIIIGGFVVACFVPEMPKENLTALSGLAGVCSVYYFRSRESESSDTNSGVDEFNRRIARTTQAAE